MQHYFSIMLYPSVYLSTSTILTDNIDGNFMKHFREPIKKTYMKYELSSIPYYI